MKKFVFFIALASMFVATSCQKNNTDTLPSFEYTMWEGTIIRDIDGTKETRNIRLEFEHFLTEENDTGGSNLRVTTNYNGESLTIGARYFQEKNGIRINNFSWWSDEAIMENGLYWITEFDKNSIKMEYVNGSKTITLDLRKGSI